MTINRFLVDTTKTHEVYIGSKKVELIPGRIVEFNDVEIQNNKILFWAITKGYLRTIS